MPLDASSIMRGWQSKFRKRDCNVEEKAKPEYPTEEQIDSSWKAYKQGGEKGILEFLKVQRRKREAESQLPQK